MSYKNMRLKRIHESVKKNFRYFSIKNFPYLSIPNKQKYHYWLCEKDSKNQKVEFRFVKKEMFALEKNYL